AACSAFSHVPSPLPLLPHSFPTRTLFRSAGILLSIPLMLKTWVIRACVRHASRSRFQPRRAIPSCHRESSPGAPVDVVATATGRSEEHTSGLQSRVELVCRLLLAKKRVAG